MTAKEYMGRAYRLDQRINSKYEQLMQLKALAEKTTVAYGNESVSHSRNVSSMEDIVIRIIEAEHELNAEIDRLITMKKEIQLTIDLVADGDCRLLLELRYLNMKSWRDICVAFELSKPHMFRMHNKALAMIETVLRTRNADIHAST